MPSIRAARKVNSLIPLPRQFFETNNNNNDGNDDNDNDNDNDECYDHENDYDCVQIMIDGTIEMIP